MINVEKLTFFYHDSGKPAVSDIDLKIQDGELVLITGASGSGKSSLCRCFNGLIPHFYGGKISGCVNVQGLDVLRHSTKEMATKVGMVFQDPENQLVTTDVEREIAFGLENLALSRNLIARRIEESLDTVGIFNLRRRPLCELSGGEKQKVAIASVLALHPEVLIMDEPTSELDPQSAEEVLSIAKRLNDELGITIIIIEHRLDRVLPYVDRLIILDRGKIASDGKVREILDNEHQKIEELGIGLPPIVRLTRILQDKGLIENDSIPLTLKEGRSKFKKMLSGITGQVPHRNIKTGNQPIIEVEKLWYAYPEGPTVIRNVTFKINSGDFVAVMGRNASGKTTLIRHFNGLLKPTRGKVMVKGTDTRKMTAAELARTIGWVSQNPNDHLFADTVEEEIIFTLKNLGFDTDEIIRRVNRVIDRFRLHEYRRQYPRSLSGGEKQRVALASVVAVQPQVLILDEPTRGMEYHIKKELMEFLSEYARQGNTVILVTHDVEIAAELVNRVILMSEGEIVVEGARHEVLSGALLFSPQINRLVQPFEKYGAPGDILTVEELMQVLE